jgi:hypothetical protein
MNQYQEVNALLSHTFISDETLIHHYEPERKCQEYGKETPNDPCSGIHREQSFSIHRKAV